MRVYVSISWGWYLLRADTAVRDSSPKNKERFFRSLRGIYISTAGLSKRTNAMTKTAVQMLSQHRRTTADQILPSSFSSSSLRKIREAPFIFYCVSTRAIHKKSGEAKDSRGPTDSEQASVLSSRESFMSRRPWSTLHPLSYSTMTNRTMQSNLQGRIVG